MARAKRRKEEYAIVRMETTVPDTVWYSAFSRRHPELVLELTNDVDLAQNRILVELTIRGSRTDFGSEFREYSEIQEVESVPTSTGARIYRILFVNPWGRRVVADLQLFIRHPRMLQNGVISFEVFARLRQVRSLVRQMRSMGFAIRVISTRRAFQTTRGKLLTRIQEERFRQAVDLGYFEVPRRISLQELAKRMSRSPSSVSRILAEIERKLVDWGGSVL